ncbi:SOS response-associated peptidase [Amaricoccus sp.]|uniref:SOS response-associated peptidase n=1 Tax=Amaricoccus sp. TaxID=1872485 RepID=UPI001B4AC0A1|nr:SOS response-associated peptidase [Amaricoccus sp.]MBP7242911.1 SOS response-associated peptidase [Amaricoccus sp.]
MCGRYMITTTFAAMASLFDAEPVTPGSNALSPDAPRLNVSPTETVPAVVSRAGARRIEPMRWGLLPPWHRSPKQPPLLINARAETIAEKPAFRDAARERRCLIPADGFYEWQGEKGSKIPYLIRPRAGGPIAFAGVWQEWGPPAERILTCAIVTCAANATLAPIHDRMPVVIAPADFALWLGEAGHGAAPLMVPAPDDALVATPADAETRRILARRGG